MQTNNLKQVSPPKILMSNISTLQTDYGSTTATENVSLNDPERSLKSDHYQKAGDSRFSNHSERKNSSSSSRREIRSVNSGFSYQNLNETRKSSTLNIDSRFPSFLNLPASSTGRFRFHAMESSGKQTKTQPTALRTLEYSLNVLNHVLVGFVTIFMSWICLRTGLAGTALHAWLVTIGFVLLMSEGIMCHYPGNVLTFTYDRDTKTRAHWILQAFGGGLGMIGALIKLIQKGFLLTSTHGQLGFAALILCAISMLSGLSALYSMRLKRLLSPLLNKSVHNLLGYITFVIAMLAQFYGYKTGYFTRKTEGDFRDLMKSITIISLALSSIGPLKALLRKTDMIYRQYINY